jgi:PAS domain S-box-containing protein
MPLRLFFLLILPGGVLPVLIKIVQMIVQANYAFIPHISYTLILFAIVTIVALLISFLSRSALYPVLAITADQAQDTRVRVNVRQRLALVVLSLNLVAFCFASAVSLNQIYQEAKSHETTRWQQWAQDAARTASYLDQDTFTAFVADSEIFKQHQASVQLTDPQGRRFRLVSNLSTTQSFTTLKPQEYATLTVPIERNDGTWQLDILHSVHLKDTRSVRNTLLILTSLGAITFGLTLATVHYLANDIIHDLKYVTARLLDIARHGRVGEELHTASLAEIDELVGAFDRVHKAITQQQNELDRRMTQMRQLSEASLTLATTVDFQYMLDRICEITRDVTGSTGVVLYLYNPDEDLFVRASELKSGIPSDSAQAGYPPEMTRTVLARQSPILIQDTTTQQFLEEWTIQLAVRSFIVVPVISRQQVMGVLYVSSHKPNTYNEQDIQIVSALASQAGTAIENARLLEETMLSAQVLEERARNLLMINRISTALTSSLDPYEIFSTTAKHMVNLMEGDHCEALIFDKGAQEGTVVAEYPEIGRTNHRMSRADNPAIDHVLATKQLLAIADIRAEPLLAAAYQSLADINVRAALIVPLIARDTVIGTINLYVLWEPHQFSKEDQELCKTIAAQAAIAVSNARLLYNLRQQSHALSRKSQELTEESAKLDAVLTNMADGLVVSDLTGHIMLSNPAFKTMAGFPTDQPLRGRRLNQALTLGALETLINSAIENPSQVTAANLELDNGRVLKASASPLLMKQSSDPFQPNQIKGVVTVLRDITHEVEIDRMKTDFISAVSHELRTPLTSILGFAHLIQRDIHRWVLPAITGQETKTHNTLQRIQTNLHIIETESQRLTRLVNDVLDIAKMESGRIEWNLTKVNIQEVIQDSINATSALAREKNLPINTRIKSSLPLVWSDKDRLIQVMTNLLSNAIKFTNQGQITVSSWVWKDDASAPAAMPLSYSGTHVSKPALVISVSDTGIGISQQDLPYVFDRFRQVGNALTAKPSGTGLGLSLCKEIVERRGGSIWVESELGAGSTFYFTLPLTPKQIQSVLHSSSIEQ